MKYTEMNIEKPILQAIAELGFEEATKIQEKGISAIQERKDVIGQSETGSGKTAAFGIPIIEKVERGKGIQALIVAPTRELVEQIAENLRQFSKYKRSNITTVYGGVSINPQIDYLRNTDIVVGTPGRLLDHINRGTINFSRTKFVVLDEADKMFEMGFVDDTKRIFEALPREKQVLMFSATINKDVLYIAGRYMKNPLKIQTNKYVEKRLLKQVYYNIKPHEKFSLLTHLLKAQRAGKALVFCGTRGEVDAVAKNLYKQGIDARAIHGGLTQHRRNSIMDDFKQNGLTVLVASDVAARGIDVKDLTHIFNYNIPKTSKEYVHRIGRTARMGDSGIAINLLCEKDYENFNRVLSDHTLEIEKMQAPNFERVQFVFVNERRGEFRGNRFSNRFGKNKFGKEHSEAGSHSRSSRSHSHNFGQRRNFRQGWNN